MFSDVLKSNDKTTTLLVANEASAKSRDLSQSNRVSIGVNNGGTETCVFTVEGSVDGANWSPIAWTRDGTGTYAITSVTAAISAKIIVFLHPDYFVRYVRVNVSDGNATAGTTFTVYGDA